MARLAVEGERSIYYEHYAGPGRPVVLVHGWGMSIRCWDGVLAALLGNGNEVLAFDQRCCGRSDKDFDDVSVAAHGSDVVALVEHVGLRDPVVNGWSFGGAVAADAAAKLDGGLGGVVLTCPAAPRWTASADWPYGGTADDLAGTLAALRDNRVETLRGVAAAVFYKPVGDHTVDWMWDIFLETSPRADASLESLGESDQRELYRGFRAPVLVILGRHDVIVSPEGIAASIQLLDRARLVAFEDSGHAPFIEEAAKYRGELLAFLDSLG